MQPCHLNRIKVYSKEYGGRKCLQHSIGILFLQAEQWPKRWECLTSRRVFSPSSVSMRFSKTRSGQRSAPAGPRGSGWQTSEGFSNQLSRYWRYIETFIQLPRIISGFQRFSRMWLFYLLVTKIKKWRHLFWGLTNPDLDANMLLCLPIWWDNLGTCRPSRSVLGKYLIHIFFFQEPFCPPKPSMPSQVIFPSCYLEDLVKLFEVGNQSFCLWTLQTGLFRTPGQLTSSSRVVVLDSLATSLFYPQVKCWLKIGSRDYVETLSSPGLNPQVPN